MEEIKFLKYILSRIGIMIVLTLFSAFAGIVLIPALVTVFPSFFLRLFYDDGKRHAAYENWSWVNITIVYLLMLLVYFIPAIFRDSFSQEGKGDIFYKVLYYPCIWLNEGVGIGIGLLLAASYCFYLIAYKVYVHKHPVILKSMKSFSAGKTDNKV